MKVLRRIYLILAALIRHRRRIWFGLRVPLAIGLLFGLTLPLPTHSDTIACPLQARLSVGSLARVAYALAITASTPHDLRDYPDADAPLIDSQPPGAPLRVLKGPTCTKGVRWWQVQPLNDTESAQSLIGWMAETGAQDVYTLEPWQALIDYAQTVPDGAAILRVNTGAIARWLIAEPIAPIANRLTFFPYDESRPLITAYAAAYVSCPDRAAWRDPAVDQQMTVYRSPDSTRLLTVRHVWRSVQKCDGTLTARYGLDRLSLIAPDGERVLFDVPLHARLNSSLDNSGSAIPDDQTSHIADVIWSPDNIHALAWVTYRSTVDPPPSQLFLIDVVRGTIHSLDSGFAPVWNVDGTRLSWFRNDTGTIDLIQTTPDAIDRQTLNLPTLLQFSGSAFPPIWNSTGTRFVACVRADHCESASVVDLQSRRALTPQTIPSHMIAPRWILDDHALLWLPDVDNDHPARLIVQRIADGDNLTDAPLLQSFDVPIAAGEHLIDAAVFPDGQHVLIVIRGTDNGSHYQVLNLIDGTFQKVQLAG